MTAPAGPPAPGPAPTGPHPAAPAPGQQLQHARPATPHPAAPPMPPRPPAPQPMPPRPPAPPSALSRVLTTFWREGRRPLPLSTLGISVLAGALGAVLTVGSRPGLGLTLTALLLWTPAVPALLRRRAFGELVMAAASVALVAVAAVRDADWLVGLSLVVAVLVAAVAATSSRSAPAVLTSLGSWAAGVIRSLPWLRAGVGDAVGSRRHQVAAALRSVAVTVVLLVVFGVLFASADTVFASYLPRLDLGLLPARVVVGAALALAAVTAAHLVLAPPPWSGTSWRRGRPAGRGEWLLPVTALDALVLAFVLVQAGALLGGHRHVLETAGLTYAEYARQGFAQLVAATALTLLVVAVAAHRAPRATARDRLVSKVALGVLCVGTLGVVASALRRIDLYVDAFGLTRTRLLVVFAELALAAVLLLVLAAGVRWQGRWLPRAVVLVVAVAMLSLAAVNPDAQILRHNTTADLDGGLDVRYLHSLSADAVPAIEDLDGDLRECLLDGQRTIGEPDRSLGSWNLGRQRAEEVLERFPDDAQVPADCGLIQYRG